MTYSPAQPLCTDDFGNSVYECHWTKQPVSMADAVMVGGYVPGVKVNFISRKGYESIRRDSYVAFADSERNCNTCKHLKRVKHGKDKAGFLYGECKINSKEEKLYPMRGDVMMFHPDDPMHMDCYESRFN